MCGLVAVVVCGGQSLETAALSRMTHVLEHRGPDDFGFAFVSAERQVRWRDEPPLPALGEGVALGHRRLSILDLSEAGRQPFSSEDGRYWLVYNGEVYNYIELRDELEHAGWRFRTGTDTEVVLRAYQHWGDGCFERFNGMWGLVIWDNERQELIASRDRFGIKPLYYQRIGSDWVLASEAKAILEHPRAHRAPDDEVVVAYLAGLRGPGRSRTFFDQVSAVEPATVLRISGGKIAVRRYWHPPRRNALRHTCIEEAAGQLGALLEDSVRLRLRSDVRVGTMLSGGVDSTSVISCIRAEMKRASGIPTAAGDMLQGFTAVFPGDPVDEEAEVDELCAMLDLRANKVMPASEADIQELLMRSSWHMEGPYFNSVPLVHTLLMRKARELGVKVVLNGHGPDELLAGYPARYGPYVIGDALIGLRFSSVIRELNAMQRTFGLGRRTAMRRALATRVPPAFRERTRVRATLADPLYAPSAARKLVESNRSALRLNDWLPESLESALRADFFERVLPPWLHLEDRISMAESIEARLPFLDYRIVEFSLSLPPRLKMSDGVTKIVLRHAARGRIPEAIRTRTRKVPFSGPERTWLGGALSCACRELLESSSSPLTRYVDRERVSAMMRAAIQASRPAAAQGVWKSLSTAAWMRVYFG